MRTGTLRVVKPSEVVRGWIAAINDHDLDHVVACFAEGYEDEAPARRGESVRGREQVRMNFERLFINMPDIHAELRGVVDEGDQVWMEWAMRGTRGDGSRMEFVGVNLFEVQDDALVRGRIYTELVRDAGGLGEQVDRMVSGSNPPT